MQPGPGRSTWLLPSEPASAGLARRHVSGACTDLGRELTDVAVLLTSELVANAFEHACGDIRLVVDVGPRRFRVEVHDGSPTATGRLRAHTTTTRGRGLLLVEKLSSEWGVVPSRDGKQVWFALRLPPDAEGRVRTARDLTSR